MNYYAFSHSIIDSDVNQQKIFDRASHDLTTAYLHKMLQMLAAHDNTVGAIDLIEAVVSRSTGLCDRRQVSSSAIRCPRKGMSFPLTPGSPFRWHRKSIPCNSPWMSSVLSWLTTRKWSSASLLGCRAIKKRTSLCVTMVLPDDSWRKRLHRFVTKFVLF